MPIRRARCGHNEPQFIPHLPLPLLHRHADPNEGGGGNTPSLIDVEKGIRIEFVRNLPPLFAALYPVNQNAATADPKTREFLLRVVDILLEFISRTNDRDEKVLDFHHPAVLKKMLELNIPEDPLPVEQLLQDCRDTLEHQVKTGEDDLLEEGSGCG